MIWLLWLACAIAFGYQITAVLASLKQLLRKPEPGDFAPPVSVLKPIRGLDPGMQQAIRSHATQHYPEYEILFGMARDFDPAGPEIRKLQSDFPHTPIRLIHSTTQSPNGKVGVLTDLTAQASHEILLVNDSDILVPPGYLSAVVAPLADPSIGIVTCLYRATAQSLPGIVEALGIATDFAPSTLVAPFVGIKEFALGSTLVFRRADLEAIGGWSAIAPYIADDYQLGKRITQLGKRVHLSTLVVETSLQGGSWSDVWRHQVRWHRTIRVSRGAYIGLPVTMATLWATLAVTAGQWPIALALMVTRFHVAFLAGWFVLRSSLVIRYFWLIPIRDLFAVAVWVAGLTGSRVRWRDEELELTSDGRIRGKTISEGPA